MKLHTDNGIELDSQGGFASTIQSHLRKSGLDDMFAFLATEPNGCKTYVIYGKDGLPVTSNQNFETICAEIDVWKLSRDLC